MIKRPSIWKKAGTVAAISLPLILSGFTINKGSGLEGKIRSISMTTAYALVINQEGYEVPDLTGLKPYAKGYLKSEPRVYVERFFTKDAGRVAKFSYDNGKELKTFGYTIDHNKINPGDYTICDNDGDGIFETKYKIYEEFDIPAGVKP